jgi:enoyl-CoA hydratase/carnithine racemase
LTEASTPLRVRKSDCVAWVQITHPPINLLDLTLFGQLDAATRALAADDDVRVIVFESGLAEFFLSHADMRLLQMARDGGAYANTSELGLYTLLLERLRTMPKATIGKVRGRARGGGAEFVLALDMAFAAPTARFSQMEILLGINPGGGGAQYLARKAGRSRALELVLGGGDIEGQLAAAYGYVNRILPDAELDAFVDDLARRIATFPVEAIVRNKANILTAGDDHLPGLLDATVVFSDLVARAEFDRRVAAFLSAGGQTREGELTDLASLSDALA